MEFFHTNIDSARIETITFNLPEKSVNTFSPASLAALSDVICQVERDQPAAVIFASAKPKCFIAGADLFEIHQLDRDALEQFLRDGQTLFSRIAHLPMPTVAAINGDCLGGGLELALACTWRVAASAPSIKIGLPEVMLGIIPGWGGAYRLPRLIGLSSALPLILTGKTLAPKKALAAGIVDEVVRPEALLDAARRLAVATRKFQKKPLRGRLESLRPIRRRILTTARNRVESQSHGHYPAPLRMLDVIETGLIDGESAALEAERRTVLDLTETSACHNLMRVFFLRQDAKRLATNNLSAAPQDVRYAAVIGGGTMGAGIAHALITSGITVRLIEVNPAAVSAALVRIRRLLDDDIRAGRTDALAARHAMNRVIPAHQWTGLAICDFAIEAVLEKIELKLEVFEKLNRLMPPHAPLATNTSALSIARIAQAIRNPARVVGLHFFNPVPKMPLVEVIRTHETSPTTLATAVALAARLGKAPVIVNDSPGFLVNRLLIPYLAEAAQVAAEGVPIETIDKAMKHWGWPMGPFELLDQIGLDIAAEVLVAQTGALPPQMAQMIQRGWLGKKSGRGFYLHKKTLKPNPDLIEIWPPSPTPLSLSPATPGGGSGDGPPFHLPDDRNIPHRLMAKMFTEARNVLAEKIVDSPDTIDLATVLGLGFPPFRGGLAREAGIMTDPQGANHADLHQNRPGADGESQGPARIRALHGDGLRPLDLLRPSETK